MNSRGFNQVNRKKYKRKDAQSLMSQPDITSNGKKVINSGTFISFENGPNTIAFDYNKAEIKLEFHFTNNESNQATVQYHPSEDKKSLILNLYNFNNFIDTGLLNPLKIAEDKNSTIYIQFLVSSINKEIKKITYTFYEEKKNATT